MKKSNQYGFSPIVLIVAVVAVLLVGIVVWRVWDASQQPQQNNSSGNNQQQSNSQEPTNNNQNTEEPQTDPNEGYVVIKEWGVRFKPTTGLTGLKYFKPAALTSDQLTFTTETLASASASCSEASGQIVLGLLTRSVDPNEQNGGVLAKIGNYSYQYRAPQAACSADYQMESQIISSIIESLKSLEAAK